MAVTHIAAVRNELANLVVDHIDDGAGAGSLVIRLTGTAAAPGTEVARLTFSDPAFGAAAAGVATASAITEDSSATGNATDVSTATLEDSNSVVAAHCSVTLTGGGGDIIASSLGIAASDTVSCSSLTYTAPA